MDGILKAQLRAQIAAIESGEGSVTPDFKHSLTSQNHADFFPLQDETSIEKCPPDEQQRAFRKIERVAALREQASAALRARLAREGFSAQAIDAALERACACGLVDDARYADVLVRSRMSQGHGAQGIEAELSRLGISISIIPGWPEDFSIDHNSEVKRALALLDRKPPHAKNQRNAAYSRLIRKGFGSSIASTAARCWVESQSN